MHCMLLVSKKLWQRPEGILQDEPNERKNLIAYLKVRNKLLYINVYLALKIWINFAHQICITLHNLSTWFLFKAKLNWDKRTKLTSSFRYINRRAAIPLMPWQYPTSYQTNKQTNHAYMCFVCDCCSLLSIKQLCTMTMYIQYCLLWLISSATVTLNMYMYSVLSFGRKNLFSHNECHSSATQGNSTLLTNLKLT